MRSMEQRGEKTGTIGSARKFEAGYNFKQSDGADDPSTTEQCGRGAEQWRGKDLRMQLCHWFVPQLQGTPAWFHIKAFIAG